MELGGGTEVGEEQGEPELKPAIDHEIFRTARVIEGEEAGGARGLIVFQRAPEREQEVDARVEEQVEFYHGIMKPLGIDLDSADAFRSRDFSERGGIHSKADIAF